MQDIFIYDIKKDTLWQITNSTELSFDSQYKINLNWIDNNKILFLSKHSGVVQQYIYDLNSNSISNNSCFSSHEYFLYYSNINEETYYVASRNDNEPAVFRKKLYNQKEKKISKGNKNNIITSISPNGEYLAYREMPQGKPILLSLKGNKIIELKLPKNNVTIDCWSSNGENFIYNYSYINDNKVKRQMYIYDISTHSNKIVEDDLNFFSGCIWAPCSDTYFYSVQNLSYLVNAKTGDKIKYNINGNPTAWIESCKSILFIQDSRAFILNLESKDVKIVIN